MTLLSKARRLGVLLIAVLACTSAPAGAAPLDLDTLTAAQAEAMLKAGTLTSVELTQAYIDRINALNKRGPGLNAVTQLNKDALVEAAAMDQARAAGQDLGPAMGLPILLKDIVDAKGQYTSAGNYSLRNSFPAEDSGIVKKLRAHGVIILGKLGLSEFANSFGNQPSGFSNLTGQVLNANDSDQNPSGSSSGTGSAISASLSSLGIGTETSGSIISPSAAQSLVGLRPTIGLVPPYGIAPIIASQDTAGPMERTVTDAAMVMASIAGPDPKSDAEYNTVFGPNYIQRGIIPQPPATVPDYMSALSTSFVQGKRIAYVGTLTPGTPLKTAYDALVAAGATLVQAPTQVTPNNLPAVPAGYEQHLTIDAYYAGLGSDAPIQSLVEEVADNQANAQEALKFGNATHLDRSTIDITPGGANETQFRQNLPVRKAGLQKSIDDMLSNNTPNDASDDFIAVLGNISNGPAAGYPQITIPMGYTATQRRAQSVNVNGGAYSERNLLGVGYVIEQATKLRQPPSAINPSFYRCAKTVPAPPFASRGSCNPDYDTIMAAVGTMPALGYSLETESAQSLQDRLTAGTLTSETLTKAFLSRIALTNAEGPATQAVRSVRLAAIDEAKALDAERATDGRRSLLHGLPVLVDDSLDVKGLPTTGGSIALQNATPAKDSTIVARLKKAGAIILGKTNVSELGGLFSTDMPEGYSSLGGQVLLPSDTDKTVAGSSAGSAAAAASGLAAMAIGSETSPDTAQLIAPAGVAGVVGLKPTVGRVSRAGQLPVAKSQDAPGPITRTVYDAAIAMQTLAARDPEDPATASAPLPGASYTSGLSANALKTKRIGVITSNSAGYADAVAGLTTAGATTVSKTVGTPNPDPPSIVAREFKRDVNAYLAATPGGASTLQGIIDYNTANGVEGLKYQQGELVAANTPDLSSYEADRDNGKASNAAVITGLLNNGTPADTTDDVEAMVVPIGSPLHGIADRAGYPVLTVPVAFGTGGAGRNPIGVALIAGAYSEATLLADGYALEQTLKVRQAPSQTNPSMWRCVPGSSFYSPHHCHPGDRGYKVTLNPAPTATPTATATATATATGTATAAPTATASPAPDPSILARVLTQTQRKLLKLPVTSKIKRKAKTFSVKDRFVLTGTASYTLRIKVKGKQRTLGKKTVKVTKPGKRTVKIKLTKTGRKLLRKHAKAKVTLKTVFKPDGGSYYAVITTVRTIKHKK